MVCGAIAPQQDRDPQREQLVPVVAARTPRQASVRWQHRIPVG
ncbi:hypothetical protein [Actinomadura sp. WMMA1423]|nr:hypothetical protein [Actinomadura sp. WMMA1423]